MDIVEGPREWLIRKGSLYYRPNRAGYTGIKGAAGRYTQAEAEREAAVEPGHIVAVHQDRVPDDPVPASEAAATITALRKRVEELEGALEQLEAANEQLAATRSSETYCMMLTDDGAEDALEALDGARSRARAALRAKGGEHGDA